MNVLSILSDLITSPALGAFGGVLGTLFTSVLAFFKSRQDHQQAVELRRLDLESAERMKKADLVHAGEQLASGEFSASIAHDSVGLSTDGSRLLIVAEFIRRTFRAFITTALLMSAVAFFFSEYADVVMRFDMVQATIGATVMAITWWFGDRSLAKKVRG